MKRNMIMVVLILAWAVAFLAWAAGIVIWPWWAGLALLCAPTLILALDHEVRYG